MASLAFSASLNISLLAAILNSFPACVAHVAAAVILPARKPRQRFAPGQPIKVDPVHAPRRTRRFGVAMRRVLMQVAFGFWLCADRAIIFAVVGDPQCVHRIADYAVPLRPVSVIAHVQADLPHAQLAQTGNVCGEILFVALVADAQRLFLGVDIENRREVRRGAGQTPE